ncbi:PAS domain-containing sensor histidine kinase [Rhodococcus pseudokoreensis]|uniref:PAS domain-containing sensor histidine kinase n=1 Tax=Rhodococcus pseudokoreensis TaxID=2811421 RepID=UPI001F124916|nr:PAS domain-containing sensor histidine kinase [Rhodococcus pseudokoreensis]
MQEFDSPNILQLFNGIVEQSVAGIYLLQDGVLQYVNNKFADLFDTKPDRMMGRSLVDLAPPDQKESLVAQYERRIEGTDPESHFIIRAALRKSGVRLIEIHGKRVEYRGQPAVVGVGIDVTDRERAHVELVRSRTQLQALMSEIETIQETERARIAMELHDDVGGILTALKFDVARLKRRIERLSGQSGQVVDTSDLLDLTLSVSELAQEAIDSARRISDELRPTALEHLGLFAAIRDYIDRFRIRFNIDCSLILPHSESAASSAVELDLFRIIQEALTNVARHADATKVRVSIAREGDRLDIAIEDNGRGLPVGDARNTGSGLIGIRERAHRVGAEFTIDNVETGGVRIELHAPWEFTH